MPELNEAVNTMLDLSTSHLSAHDAWLLSNRGSHDRPRSVEHEYGWIVFVASDPEHVVEVGREMRERGHSPGMIRIYECAAALGVMLINFDADGEVIEGVPVHDWEQPRTPTKEGEDAGFVSAWITIGGTLRSERQLDELAGAIATDGMGDNYQAVDELAARSLINLALENGRPLILTGNEIPWGECEALQEFCAKHRLSYVRGWEAHYSFDAGVVSHRPGKPELEFASDNEGRVLLLLDQVEQAVQKRSLKSLLKQAALCRPDWLPPLAIRPRHRKRAAEFAGTTCGPAVLS